MHTALLFPFAQLSDFKPSLRVSSQQVIPGTPLPPLPPSLFLYPFCFSRQKTSWPPFCLNDGDVSQTSGPAFSGEELAVVAMVIFQGGGGGI